MTGHFGAMVLFAACVSIVFAALGRDEAREQAKLGVRIFGALVVGAYLVGWLMYLLVR